MATIVQFKDYGSPDVLELVDIDPQTPAAGEVRIAIKAFGVQRADTLWRQGMYVQEPKAFPAGLGYDCVGIIDAVGDGVTAIKEGDKVMSVPGFSLNDYAVYGNSAVIHEKHITPLPEADLSWEEFAAIPVPYYTGYFPLFEVADIRTAKYVLVTAASSSTGLAAIQMAKAEGATVIATSRTLTKKDALLELGADHVVATEEGDPVEAIRAIVGEDGVDVIYDPIGGKMIETWYQVIKRGGTIIHYGLLDIDEPTLPLMLSISNVVTLKSYMIFEFTGNDSLGLPPQTEALKRAHAYIRKGIESGALKPVVAKSFDLADVAESHRYMESNAQVGKIVVTA